MSRLLFILAALLPLCLHCTCGPAPVSYAYRFLNPRVVGYDSELAPFFLHFGQTYREELEQPLNLQRRLNVEEWRERFCEAASDAEIEEVVYGNNLRLLEQLSQLLQRPKTSLADLPPALARNGFARHLLEDRCTEVVDYLIFAKRCEPHVTRPADPFAPVERDSATMENLIETGLGVFMNTESHYVRLRYAYQIIRLAHYLGEYAYVLELYDYLMPKIGADPSLIDDWIEGHRAGALQSSGDFPQSAYLFSRIFERSPSKRESAYRSFKIRTDEEWRQALLLCQNDRERAMLHVLRAHDGRAIVLEEMRAIYAFDPDNRSLELLTMRELQELERELLGQDFRPGGYRPPPDANDRLIELQSFVNRVIEEGESDRPDFWQLARGVLELLAGDYFYAEETLADLGAETENDTIRQQVEILTDVLEVLELDRVTDSVELRYYELLTDRELSARYPDFELLVNNKLEQVYRKTGRGTKADLLQYGWPAIAKRADIDDLRSLERMADSLNRNRFDRALLRDRIGTDPVARITDLVGNHYFQRGQWKTALEIYRRAPTGRRDSLGSFSPFVRQISDRINFTPPADRPRYGKVALLERLDELEEQADRTTNDTIAARNYFNIGLALYNMSYFGYDWRFADVFRSGTSIGRATAASVPTEVFVSPNAPLGNRETFTMDQPLYYFERALRRAPDREAAALAAFYAAKAERNQHYARGRPGGSRPFTYFALLRDSYADTDFYDELIAECRTFAWYVGR